MSRIRGKQLEDDTITNTQADTATGTLSTINAGDAEVSGAGVALANKLHQHPVATGGAIVAVAPDDTADEGTSANLSREDHRHPFTTAAPAQGIGAGNSEGAASTSARSDHDHTIRESGTQDLTLGAIAANDLVERSGTTLAGRASITSAQHGDQALGDGLDHAVATGAVAGFMSSTDKTKLDAAQSLSEIDAKESCLVRAQGDLTLSGEQTIDGILTSANRVLVDQQTTTTQDGIYVTAAGAWARSADLPTGAEARGVRVWIEEGTVDGDRLYACSNNEGADIVGTDDLTFGLIGAGSPRGAGTGLNLNGNDIEVVPADASLVTTATTLGVGVLQTDAQHGVRGGGTQHADVVAAGADGFMTGADKTKLDGITALADPNLTKNQEAVTTQVITGTDTAITDTLNATPDANAEVELFLNGVFQKQGATFDYTIAGSTITWLASSGTAVDMDTSDKLDAVYYS